MKPGFGRYSREEFCERVRRGLDWHEELRQVRAERLRNMIHETSEDSRGTDSVRQERGSEITSK